MNRLILVFVLMVHGFPLSADEPRSETPKQNEVPSKWTGHASRELLIAGWYASAVTEQFGAPAKTRKADFTQPAYGGKVPANVDEQWAYPYANNMGHRLIYFSRGRVVLAIEEWSDF